MVESGKKPGKVSGPKVQHEEIKPGVDLEIEVGSYRAKETIILKAADSPTRFVFPLNLKGLTAELDQKTGIVAYRDNKGAVRGDDAKGFMFDSSIDPRSGDPARSLATLMRWLMARAMVRRWK